MLVDRFVCFLSCQFLKQWFLTFVKPRRPHRRIKADKRANDLGINIKLKISNEYETWACCSEKAQPCRSDSSERKLLVLFSCLPEMRASDHTHMMMRMQNTTQRMCYQTMTAICLPQATETTTLSCHLSSIGSNFSFVGRGQIQSSHAVLGGWFSIWSR